MRPCSLVVLVAALGLPLGLGAAEKIEGQIVDVRSAGTTTTDFELLRDGPRYLLKLTPRQPLMPPSYTKDGMLVPWVEIGSDGTDLFVVRQVDSAVLKTGALMAGYVLPGRKIPSEFYPVKSFPLMDPLPQLLFLAYLSDGISSAQELFPDAMISGEEGTKAGEIQVSLKRDRELGGLPVEAQFRAPGYVYLSAEALRRNPQFKTQAKRVGMSGSYRLPLPPPYETGFMLVRHRVLEKLKVGETTLPAKVEVQRFSTPSTEAVPKIIREYRITVTHASAVTAPPIEAFRPRIAPDGTILDFRSFAAKLSGKPQRFAARNGWPSTDGASGR